ncbi:hypothetical protein EL09_15535 [Salmonella enterica subsp. enterica]|nr:hypothetical protein [Salmonella enterica subsp. enterica]MIF51127.1 hypothetical protein [Salmonella enterica subsp. enterica]
MWRITVKKCLFTGLLVIMTAFIIWLSVRYTDPALRWQQTLQQAQAGLLVWRTVLYIAVAGGGWWLRQHLKSRNSALLPRFTRLAYWSLALLILSEISNALQWGMLA